MTSKIFFYKRETSRMLEWAIDNIEKPEAIATIIGSIGILSIVLLGLVLIIMSIRSGFSEDEHASQSTKKQQWPAKSCSCSAEKPSQTERNREGCLGFSGVVKTAVFCGLSGVMVHYRGNAEGVRLKNGKVAAGRFLPSSFRPMIWFEDSTPESAAFSKKRRSWSGVLEKTESEGFHSNVVCMKFIVYSPFFYIDFHKCGSAATFTSHKIQRVLCAFSARCMQCLAFLAFLGRASR